MGIMTLYNLQGIAMTQKNIGNEEVTAWVTRFALSEGIFKVTGYVPHDISDKMFCYEGGKTSRVSVYGKDWHRTEELAIARAEEMRLKKIETLKKSLKEMEALDFGFKAAEHDPKLQYKKKSL